MVILGIDPGASGGIAVWSGGAAKALPMPSTERDISDLLEKEWVMEPVVFLEKVNAFPKQGVSSVWAFSANYNFIRGVITVLKYPLYDVSPSKWQRYLGCMTKGDKNISKQKAQQLFPQLRITHAIADALLIMEYGRRTLV